MSTTNKSYVQRLIEALAQIDQIVSGAEGSPVMSLAPEVVVERVRAYVARRDLESDASLGRCLAVAVSMVSR